MSSFITLYDYVPAGAGVLTPEQERTRIEVKEFKEGVCPEHIKRDVASEIRKIEEKYPGNCTVCFVPASRRDLTVTRYMDLVQYLSAEFPGQVYLNTIELCDSYDEIIEESRKFACNLERVKGRTVIFIDDIYNTGGSYAEIVSLLENIGAKDAYGIYIARVVRS